MAFKQNREAGSKLGSYTGMQEKGLLNKVKEKITEKRESKAIAQRAEIDALKAKRDAHMSDKDSIRIKIEKVPGVGESTKAYPEGKPELMQVGYKADADGKFIHVSTAPYNPPTVEAKGGKTKKLSDWRLMRQAIHKGKKKIRQTPNLSKKDAKWKDSSTYGYGQRTRIKQSFGFGPQGGVGAEDDITKQDFGKHQKSKSGSGSGGNKVKGLAAGGAALIIGSFLAGAKNVISGKPGNVKIKTPYSNTNPTQETLRSGRGKIEK
jgi:hypothetical protein